MSKTNTTKKNINANQMPNINITKQNQNRIKQET